MKVIVKHTLALAFLLGLLLPVIAVSQDANKLKADLVQGQNDRKLKETLSELQSAIQERGDELSSNQLAEHAGWVLEKFVKWRGLHPPELSQLEIIHSPPLNGAAPAADPFSKDAPDIQVREAVLNEFDFSLTLNSIFNKIFSTEPVTSLPTYISLAKKHPVLRTESAFLPLLNNYLISAHIHKITSEKKLPQSLPKILASSY